LEDEKHNLHNSFIIIEKNIQEIKNKGLNFKKFEFNLSQVIEKNIDSCIESNLPLIESKLENIEYNSVSLDFIKGLLSYAKENRINDKRYL
jgi:hypothetical protein